MATFRLTQARSPSDLPPRSLAAAAHPPTGGANTTRFPRGVRARGLWRPARSRARERSPLQTLAGAAKPTPEKLSEYECGFPAFEDPRSQFDVRFYLVAILFIIFDLEAAFLYPWAVSVFSLGWTAWAAMMIFIGELALGLVYAWKKGALDWE